MRSEMDQNDGKHDRAASNSTPESGATRFNYDGIPKGYYDEVLRAGHPVRRLWQLSKFERVLDYLPHSRNQSILDIGCFAGTFLSLVPETRFSRQLGVDILAEQIDYAEATYGTRFRKFRHVATLGELAKIDQKFDCISLIEVIEHLPADEIRVLLDRVVDLLEPGGKFVLTTPNYASSWPLIEIIVNRLSEVSYEEQHVTKFTYFNIEKKLASIYPDLRLYFDAVDFKTTTHFLTPFLAALSFDGARRLSRVIPHERWKHPFGNLILMVLTRSPTRRRA